MYTEQLILLAAALIVLPSLCAAEGNGIPKVAEEIRAEGTRSNRDPVGRPLPLAASWNKNATTGFSPDYELEAIEKGAHLLPWFLFPSPTDGVEKHWSSSEKFFRRCVEWKLPITLIGTQWQASLYDKNLKWRNLPEQENPCYVALDGTVGKKLSPFGAVVPWREVGRYWTDGLLLKKLQTEYPDPPRVILLSNNEPADLRWHQVETSKRYMEKYGPGRDDDFKRKVVGDGWIERYAALREGLRDGLIADAWKKNVLCVGYEAFGPPHFARWAEWPQHALTIPGRATPETDCWDGGSPSYYTHDWNVSTDYKVWSPQIESMNWVFMLEEVHAKNPEFWFEISIWDGAPKKIEAYTKCGQTFTPERYAGFIQFGMWLLMPRCVREFRFNAQKRSEVQPYFEALVAAVDRIYADPVLMRFWRKGRLVPNRAHKHPYQTLVPDEWKNVDRWFLLDTNLDASWPWKHDTEVPVFSLARVLGEAGQREWLVYAHSPLKERTGVELTIPGYDKTTIDVPIGGAFYHVKEEDRSVTRVGQP